MLPNQLEVKQSEQMRRIVSTFDNSNEKIQLEGRAVNQISHTIDDVM